MNTSIIIYAVIGLIVVSLVVTAVIQQREQIAAAKKQKATQFVYKSRNAEALFEKISEQNVNPEILHFMLKLIVSNYKAAAKICPAFNNIHQLVSRAESQQSKFKPSSEPDNLVITDENQLRAQVAKINKLHSFLKKQVQSSSLNAEQFKIWGLQLKTQSQQFEIDGLMKLTLRALDASMPGTAKNHIENIENKLNAYPLEPTYQAQRKNDLDNIKLQLKTPTEEQPEDDEDDQRPIDEKTKW